MIEINFLGLEWDVLMSKEKKILTKTQMAEWEKEKKLLVENALERLRQLAESPALRDLVHDCLPVNRLGSCDLSEFYLTPRGLVCNTVLRIEVKNSPDIVEKWQISPDAVTKLIEVLRKTSQ